MYKLQSEANRRRVFVRLGRDVIIDVVVVVVVFMLAVNALVAIGTCFISAICRSLREKKQRQQEIMIEHLRSDNSTH